MVACPWEVIWPDVGDPMLLADLEPAPQDVQFWSSSDEAPAVGGILDAAVEAAASGGVQRVKGAGRQRRCLQCERPYLRLRSVICCLGFLFSALFCSVRDVPVGVENNLQPVPPSVYRMY